jgi:hypothetical protein
MNKPTNECTVSDRYGSTKAVSRDCPLFEEKLTSVLSKLEEDQCLIISAKKGNRFVQFACQGAWGMRAEVTCNHFLKGEDRLTRRQMSWLRSHGWNAPTGNVSQATPEKDPDGSPNYYIDFPAPLPVGEIAHIAMEALLSALEVPHPGLLVYEAFDDNRKMHSFEELGLKPAIQLGKCLQERLLEVCRKVTGIAGLKCDEDGDISVPYGKLVVRVSPLFDKVRLLSMLISGIDESPSLLRKLNQINMGPYGIRCILDKKTIIAAFDLLANPFVPDHLADEIREFAAVAEALALEMHADLASNSLVETTTTSNHLH